MPDPKRPTPGQLLYGPSGPRDSRGPDNRRPEGREAPPPKWDWVERLRWRINNNEATVFPLTAASSLSTLALEAMSITGTVCLSGSGLLI